MKTGRLRRLVRGIAAAVAEMNRAQRELMVLSTAMDRYLPHPDEPPATYDEFLMRTSGVLLREPPASRRPQRGRPR